MPTLAHPPCLQPPQSLNEQLVQLSHYCNIAVADASPQALLLACTVRNHVVTPLRHLLFNNQLSNQLQDHITTVTTLHALFETFLTPETTVPLAKIYSALENAIAPLGPGHTRQTLTAIWHDLHSLLAPHIAEWISRGLIHDPINFFITSHQHDKYTVDYQNLPPFITPHAAKAILEAGLARRTLAAIAPQNQSPFISVHLPPPCTTVSMVAASMRWRHDATTQLSDVFPFDQLRDKLIVIRDQLLQGDRLFWRSFFDQLRRYDLHPRAENDDDKARVERALNAVLIALSDGHPPFVFILRGGVLPSVPLSFVERQLFEKRCDVYTDLFSISFNARRSSENSRHAFVHLNRLHRQLRSFENGLIQLMALRQRMGYVVEAFESYIHLGVLQPGFGRVLRALNGDITPKKGRHEDPLFEVVVSVHNSVLDDIVAKCFLREPQVRARLTAIFGLSLAFSDFILGLTEKQLKRHSVQESTKSFSVEFDRNLVLLLRLLSRAETEKPEASLSLLMEMLEKASASITSW